MFDFRSAFSRFSTVSVVCMGCGDSMGVIAVFNTAEYAVVLGCYISTAEMPVDLGSSLYWGPNFCDCDANRFLYFFFFRNGGANYSQMLGF